jgi:2-isopropylmalate synthase
MLVQPNKAIVGANAFSHESGIHQDGVLKNKLTYEIMDAQLIGLTDNQIVLGKLSGRNAFRSRLQELGYDLADGDLNKAFVRFKAIVNDETQQAPDLFKLELVQISCGSNARPTATITLRLPNGEEVSDAAIGTGPVDAIYKAINRIANVPNQLIEYSVQSVTAGIDAIGEVTIRLKDENRVFSGHAANTDIIVASAQAYVNALNRLYSSMHSQRKHAQMASQEA